MRIRSSTGEPGHAVDVADDTWVAAPPDRVAAVVADPARWRRWWPDVDLVVTRDRGVKGQQWVLGRGREGPRRRPVWSGSMEIWLEPWRDGVLVHHYARLDAVPALSARQARRARDAHVRRWKHAVHALKDELEGR